MVVVVAIASFVGLLGGAGAGNTYRNLHPSEPDPTHLAADFTWLAVALVVASGFAGAASCLLMAAVADPRLSGWSYVAATALAASMQVLMVLVTDARFALGQFTAGAHWAAIAAGAGFAGVCVALAAGGDAAVVVAAQAGGQTVVLVFAASAATRARALVWARPSRAGVGMLLHEGPRSLVLPLAIVVVSRFDRLVLAVFGTTDAVAVYALAATVVEIARLAPTAIGQLTTREIATGADWRVFRGRMRQGIAAAAVAGAVLTVFAFLAFPSVFGPAYAQAPAVTVALLGSEVVSAIIIVANLAIIGGAWSTEAIRIGVVAIVVALPAYVIGAILGGMFGVAYARLFVFVVLAAVMWVVVRRRLSSSVYEPR
jgi:O-antigen/teichoic acid export membrane protein